VGIHVAVQGRHINIKFAAFIGVPLSCCSIRCSCFFTGMRRAWAVAWHTLTSRNNSEQEMIPRSQC
jgi:hypothetical protein